MLRARDAGASIAHEAVRSPGQPLEAATRAHFESRLGQDFSSVRVHADGDAARAAQAVEARAFTIGQHIAFASGEYAPTSSAGSRLLAHELTHVVQQRRGVSLDSGIGQAGDAYERHADSVANAVAADRPAQALLARGPGGGGGASGPAIQRDQPPAAPAPAPAPAAADAKADAPQSEGDKMRQSIIDAAQGRNTAGTTIVSADDIKKIQEGYPELQKVTENGVEVEKMVPTKTPIKNFTTCIEFAGQTFSDAAKARSAALGRTTKESQQAGRALSDALKILNQEFGLQSEIDVYKGAIKSYDKPLADSVDRQGRVQPGLDSRVAAAQAAKAKFEEARDALTASKTGDKAGDKAIDQQLKGVQQSIVGAEQTIKQLNIAIDALAREKAKLGAKLEKREDALAVLNTHDDAIVRATAPLTSHPKRGEYILLGAGSAQAYGVKKETTVTLAKGSFKHIAVFDWAKPAPSRPDKPEEVWEEWHTIDGGGTASKTTKLFVCLTDLRVQFGDPTGAWTTSTTSLIGWIDIDAIAAASPAGTGVPKAAAPAAPAAPAPAQAPVEAKP